MASSFTASARAVFSQLRAEGPATRPQLCKILSLSKPTMSLAIAELEEAGYVTKVGMIQGELGRKANMYRIGPGSGHVFAIDAGSTIIRIEVSALDGRVIHKECFPLNSSQRHLNKEMVDLIRETVLATRMMSNADWGPLRSIGIAVPSRVQLNPQAQRADPNLRYLLSEIENCSNVPVSIENNVNCAAVAEQKYGAAQSCDDFVYLQIGVKIGMGLFLGGRLIRGWRGGAGEISEMPFPLMPGMQVQPEALENYISTDAWMERVLSDWPKDVPRPLNSVEVLRLANEGIACAQHHVNVHAGDIARIAAACISVVDPDIVVLGGGLGGNPILLPYINKAMSELKLPTPVVSSHLAADATLRGISLVSTSLATQFLLS